MAKETKLDIAKKPKGNDLTESYNPLPKKEIKPPTPKPPPSPPKTKEKEKKAK